MSDASSVLQCHPGTILQNLITTSIIELSWKFSSSWQLKTKTIPTMAGSRMIDYVCLGKQIFASLQTSVTLARLTTMALEMIHRVSFWYPPLNIPYKPPEPRYRFLGSSYKVPTFLGVKHVFMNQSVLPFGCDIKKCNYIWFRFGWTLH